MVGGIVANGILFSLSPGPLMVDLKLGSGISATQGCFIEMFTTANLVLSVLMLSAGESCYSRIDSWESCCDQLHSWE